MEGAKVISSPEPAVAQAKAASAKLQNKRCGGSGGGKKVNGELTPHSI
jgi:hypothetical protein